MCDDYVMTSAWNFKLKGEVSLYYMDRQYQLIVAASISIYEIITNLQAAHFFYQVEYTVISFSV
jgi:hypothetical protein